MTLEERIEWDSAVWWYHARLDREARRFHYRTGPRRGQQIADARKHVEGLCVKKAKAEALNILDHDAEFYVNLFVFF